jgi:hypothetical protein
MARFNSASYLSALCGSRTTSLMIVSLLADGKNLGYALLVITQNERSLDQALTLQTTFADTSIAK